MTLAEILKKAGVDINNDITQDDSNTSTQSTSDMAQVVSLIQTVLNAQGTNGKEKASNNDVDSLKTMLAAMATNKDTTADTTPKTVYEDGFYTDGKVELSKISDPNLKAAFEDMQNRMKEQQNKSLIADAYKNELKNHTLAVSESAFKKIIDLSGVTVEDGKVKGIKEAFEAVGKEEGIFKKSSSPLHEGFNPVESNTGNNHFNSYASFDDAAQAQLEID